MHTYELIKEKKRLVIWLLVLFSRYIDFGTNMNSLARFSPKVLQCMMSYETVFIQTRLLTCLNSAVYKRAALDCQTRMKIQIDMNLRQRKLQRGRAE